MTRGNEHCTRTVTKLQRTLDTGQWTLGQSLKIVWKVEVYMRKYVVWQCGSGMGGDEFLTQHPEVGKAAENLAL